MEALGPPLILVSLPLWFGLIPRNRFYGLRVPPTLRSDVVCYAANATAGRDAVALGLLMVALDLTLPSDVWIWTLRIVAFVGLALVVGVNWYRATRLERDGVEP